MCEMKSGCHANRPWGIVGEPLSLYTRTYEWTRRISISFRPNEFLGSPPKTAEDVVAGQFSLVGLTTTASGEGSKSDYGELNSPPRTYTHYIILMHRREGIRRQTGMVSFAFIGWCYAATHCGFMQPALASLQESLVRESITCGSDELMRFTYRWDSGHYFSHIINHPSVDRPESSSTQS